MGMRDFLKLIEGAQGDVYTREQLEAWDIDDLDRMAFGYVGDQEIEIDPNDISIKWHDDLGNPEYKFDLGGMDWVNSVDFSEPVELSISVPGKIELEDGHHRWFAAKKLGRKLRGIIQIKGNPINVILARQGD